MPSFSLVWFVAGLLVAWFVLPFVMSTLAGDDGS